MSEKPDNVSLQLVRDDIADVPHHELPAGYRFRGYAEGDDVTWTNLHIAAEPYIDVTPELFTREFGAHRDALPDRMFFVETLQGEPVASISAWWERDRANPRERGRIHWVVVHPRHQRRGLTKPMMTRAMQRLALSHPEPCWAHLRAGRGRSRSIWTSASFLILLSWRPSPTSRRHGAMCRID